MNCKRDQSYQFKWSADPEARSGRLLVLLIELIYSSKWIPQIFPIDAFDQLGKDGLFEPDCRARLGV